MDLTHNLAKRRVFHIGEPSAALAFRQEQIPEAGGFCLGLQLFENRWCVPPGVALVQLLIVQIFVRIDIGIHELFDLAPKLHSAFRIFEIHISFSRGRA